MVDTNVLCIQDNNVESPDFGDQAYFFRSVSLLFHTKKIKIYYGLFRKETSDEGEKYSYLVRIILIQEFLANDWTRTYRFEDNGFASLENPEFIDLAHSCGLLVPTDLLEIIKKFDPQMTLSEK